LATPGELRFHPVFARVSAAKPIRAQAASAPVLSIHSRIEGAAASTLVALKDSEQPLNIAMLSA
jgi:hypothetical protein